MYVSVTTCIQTYTDIAFQFCGTRQNELKLITKSTANVLQEKKKKRNEKDRTCQLDRFFHIRFFFFTLF